MSAIVIPARLQSTRLPRKLLLDLGGKPVLKHVWERAKMSKRASGVYIATDSEEIQERAKKWGAKVLMTSSLWQSGTERIASLLPRLKDSFFLNVQGDEPFIEPDLLDSLIENWENTKCDLVTAVYRIEESVSLFNPNLVKVVRALNGRALYFSRSPIPHVRGERQEDWLNSGQAFWAHIGVYGYTRKALQAYLDLEISPLEKVEKLEQLRFIDHGLDFQTVETQYKPIGIDTPEELDAARAHLHD